MYHPNKHSDHFANATLNLPKNAFSMRNFFFRRFLINRTWDGCVSVHVIYEEVRSAKYIGAGTDSGIGHHRTIGEARRVF